MSKVITLRMTFTEKSSMQLYWHKYVYETWARLVSKLVFWGESTTQDYVTAKNNVQSVSYLVCTQVIKPQSYQKTTKSVLTQNYIKIIHKHQTQIFWRINRWRHGPFCRGQYSEIGPGAQWKCLKHPTWLDAKLESKRAHTFVILLGQKWKTNRMMKKKVQFKW